MQTFLGLDLGGTKLLIGEVDAQGNVLRSKQYVSGFLDQQAACEVLCRSLDDYIATVGWATGEPPQAMGVGLIGRVDPYAGIWHQIDPGRTQPVNLAEMLTARYGLPCRIDNDVKSATRAEQAWGVGKQSNDFVFINIGTGIAAGTVFNYFPTKESLLACIMLEDWRLCLDRMLNVPEHTETLEQGLLELEALLRAFSEPFLPVWRNYDHRAPLPEYHKVLISQLSQPLEALLQKAGIRPGETDLSVLAELLLAASQREEGTIEKLIPIMKKIVM